VTEALLEQFQIKVKKAHSGGKALEIIRQESFDIIFLDQMMPDMDGIETAASIREIESKTPGRKRNVIIALTAAAVYWEMFYANGFDGCLSKPIDVDGLVSILRKWLPKEKILPAAAVSGVSHNAQADNESVFFADKELYAELVDIFLEDNRNNYEDIISALKSGNIKQAHRLAHTLKSSAGHLGKKELQKAAADVETSLSAGENKVTDQQLNVLKAALAVVINQLTNA